MRIISISPTNLAPRSVQPVLAVAVAISAGVTAFASPFTNTSAPRTGDPAVIRIELDAPKVWPTNQPVNVAFASPMAASALKVSASTLSPVAQWQLQPPSMPPFVETGPKAASTALVLPPQQVPPKELGSYQPPAPSEAISKARPEWQKVMMAQVEASREANASTRFSDSAGGFDSNRDVQALGTGEQESVETNGAQQLSGVPSAATPLVDFEVSTRVNGKPGGRVALRISDTENISVRLDDILSALQPLMDAETYEALSSAHGAREYVTFNTLRASGISIRFDSHDRLIIGKA